MKISVIIPVRNEISTLQIQLQKLQWLRMRGHEIIVVDGGGNGDISAIIPDFADIVVSSLPGRARQMNAGADASMGELLWFLHIDSGVSLPAIQALETISTQRPQFWGRFDVALSGRALVFRCIENLMNIRSRWSGIATGDQGIFVTRDWFFQVGRFEEIPLMEDISISRTLKKLGRPVCLRQRIITSSRRWESRGVISTILLMWKLRLCYWLGVDAKRLVKQYD